MDRAHLVLIQRQHFPSIPLAILEKELPLHLKEPFYGG